MSLAGLICAFAGWVLIGRFGSVSPTAGQFANIESITAVVIGGISLFGGRGSILGMFFGALIVGVFLAGLRLVGTDPQWTYLPHRRAHHRRRRRRPVDQKGCRLMSDTSTHPHRARSGQALRPRHRARQRRFRPLSRRNPRGDRRQRRRQVDADQGDLRRRHARRGRDPADGKAGQLQVADRGARRRHRDGLPEPGAVAGAVDRRQHVPGPRDQARASWGNGSACSTGRHGKAGARKADRAWPDDHPEHQPGGGNAVGRPAPGRGGGARGGLRLEGGHHGRADRGAGRQGIAPRAGADPRREEARPADRADLAQHAACLRGGRPHPHPPARQAALRHRSEDDFDVGRGRLDDRRQEAAGLRYRFGKDPSVATKTTGCGLHRGGARPDDRPLDRLDQGGLRRSNRSASITCRWSF
jgi:hypothetical protein